MKKTFLLLAMFILAVNLAQGEELKTLGLDDPSSASPKIEADTQIKTEGKSSLKITTRWPTTVNLGEVSGLDVENAKLVYSAKVKAELEGEGTAYLEMWVHLGDAQYFSKGMNDPVRQKTDWKTIRTPFLFEKGQKPDKATLNLVINGKGTVWIDEITLSKEPLK